ncbi:hypothetical protein BDY21DRAFT_386767 [Lineolata rhizophorae]|uniref:MARVEL domain-containing protein n=1 Tax=Lineolata rhizophorae TaxID=578093 RepID=A0A6A6NX91_9PEZI|nr:hypothetical protein BDY21DRAFT_386767 [Lineolata rhizophorae]
MAVIWGLDLREIHWRKFKSSNMWNNTYHLRRTKFIVYQCAMILCVVSEALGTAALDDYRKQQNLVSSLNPSAHLHNNSFIGATSYNIFAGVFVATIFGAAFFFDLFWPERHESRSVRLAWKVCAVLACCFELAAALLMTVEVARHGVGVSGVSRAEGERLAALYKHGRAPLRYADNGRAVASAVFAWPGWVATVASAIILFLSQAHDDEFGSPLSSHARNEKAEPVEVAGSNEERGQGAYEGA